MKFKHFDHDGRARFITFGIHNHFPVLLDSAYCAIVYEVIMELKEKVGFRLLGYVIMPDHVHLVIIPRIETKVGSLIGDIKRISAKRIHQRLEIENRTLLKKLMVVRNGKRKFALWQRRCFDHNCRNDDVIWNKIRYCHENPVRSGLVNHPEKWPWSSYSWYYGERKTPRGDYEAGKAPPDVPKRELWVGYSDDFELDFDKMILSSPPKAPPQARRAGGNIMDCLRPPRP